MEVVYFTLILSITIAYDTLWLMKIISLTMILGGTFIVDLLWKENFNIEKFPDHRSS